MTKEKPIIELGAADQYVDELEAKIAEMLEAAEWILRDAGYEKGEAPREMMALRVSRFRLDNLRAAIRATQ